MFVDMQKVAETVATYLIVKLRRELDAQGHTLTGALEQSLEASVISTVWTAVIQISGNAYGAPLNTGVPAERIPYSGRTGRGGRSAYIQGLVANVERRMNLRGREAVGVAFAIANRHRVEGMPTRDSYRYSRNGRRTRWIEQTVEDESAFIESTVGEWVRAQIEIMLEATYKTQ